jgi:peroxiredoxin
MERNLWDPKAPRPGEQAPDLDLLDESGRPLPLSSVGGAGPLLVLLFRAPDDATGRRLLRDYRDSTLAFRRAGVEICAIAKADPMSLAYLRGERALGFPLLADPDGTALSRWGMIDRVGLFLLDRNRVVKQRALGERAPPDALLTFVRRGGVKARRVPVARPPLVARLRARWRTLQQSFKSLRPVR